MDTYRRISRYKSQLMGIAILLVVYGHLLYYHSDLKNYEDLHFTEWYTLISVEIFLFLSGFGVFQSLKKNSDAMQFYGRRLQRLLPSYLPVMIVWCGINLVWGKMRLTEAVGNLTALGWWFQTGNQFNWYVPAVLVLYLLSPLFYDCICRKKTPWVFAVLILINIAGWRSHLMLALSRFPTYFLGMYFGAQYAEGRIMGRRTKWALCILGIAAMAAVPAVFRFLRPYLWYYGMYWYLFFLAVPMVAIVLTKLMDLAERIAPGRGLNRFWKFFGDRSFEIYLCHLAFYDICLKLGFHSWRSWVVIALAGTAIGIAFHEVVRLCTGAQARHAHKSPL